jgi:hypothetical protein
MTFDVTITDAGDGIAVTAPQFGGETVTVALAHPFVG